jgi:hypothetical protein
MNINPLGSSAQFKSIEMLNNLVKFSNQQSFEMAEKLIKVNAEMTIGAQTLESVGQVIDILV